MESDGSGVAEMKWQINEKSRGTRGWTRITRFDLIKRNLSNRKQSWSSETIDTEKNKKRGNRLIPNWKFTPERSQNFSNPLPSPPSSFESLSRLGAAGGG